MSRPQDVDTAVHDSLNILSAILGFCHLGRAAGEACESPFLHDIERAAQKVCAILRGLSETSQRIPQESDIGSVLLALQSLLETLLAPKKLTISIEAGLPPIHVDSIAFERAIINLIVNAGEAMTGGCVQLVADLSEDMVSISVINEGPDIDAHTISQMLLPSFSTKMGEGRGLGLPFVKKFVDKGGGTLSIQSTAGKTCVEMKLPIKATAPLILLIDDEAFLTHMLSLALEAEGYGVHVAASKEAGLSFLTDRAHDVRLIVADSGLEVISDLKSTYPSIPAVLMSAHPSSDACVPFLLKPFSIQKLMSTIQNALSLGGLSQKRVLIVEAPYYENIASLLKAGACQALDNEHIAYDIISVPGALEIPAAIAMAVNGKLKYDGFIALGCVIQGETTHFDIVAHVSAHQLADLSARYALALGNGILTVQSEKQALERADSAKKNKGGWAAQACMRMMLLKDTMGEMCDKSIS